MRSGLTIFLFSLVSVAATETRSFDSNTVKEIELANEHGVITILPSVTPQTEVMADKVKFGAECSLRIEQKGKTLKAKVTKPTGSQTDCEVNFEVRTPKQVELEIKNGAGDVIARQIEGEVEFQVGSGAVTIDGAAVSKLEGKVGSGKIIATGLTGGADVKTGAGDINLTYATKPGRKDIEIRTGTGDGLLILPEGSLVKTKFRSGTGRLENQIGENPSGTEVEFHSGTGSLTIKKGS